MSTDDRSPAERAATGRELRERAQGAKAEKLQEALAALDPDAAAWADEFIFGTVWDRPGLEFEDRMLVAITALAAQGNTAQLRNYLHGALQDGMPPAKIHEAILMLVVYCGFPTALGALGVWREVHTAHRERP
jgi:4-carboxymuconolactone decarboxylase